MDSIILTRFAMNMVHTEVNITVTLFGTSMAHTVVNIPVKARGMNILPARPNYLTQGATITAGFQ